MIELADLLEGRKPKSAPASAPVDAEDEKYNKETWSSDEEGNLKLQKKAIRKKLQSDDDPNEPFGYRKGKKNLLGHLLTWKFAGKEDDKRKVADPDKIAKMQAGRGKKTQKESMEDYLKNI